MKKRKPTSFVLAPALSINYCISFSSFMSISSPCLS